MFIKKSTYEKLVKEIEDLKSQLVISEAHGKSIEENYTLAVKQNQKLLNEISLLKPKKHIDTKVDNSYETKSKAVKEHLLNHGSITSWDAIKLYKATRLSDIIFKLKRKGMDISTTPETNGKARFVRYHLNKAVK